MTVVGSDGATTATIPTSSPPAQAIATLTAALGASPVVTQAAASYCQDSFTITDWDGALRIFSGENYPLPAGYTFGFGSSAPKTREGTRIEGPGGVAVGDSGATLLAHTPRSDVDSFLVHDGEAANVWLDLTTGSTSEQVGVTDFLSSTSGRAPVAAISGPAPRIGQC